MPDLLPYLPALELGAVALCLFLMVSVFCGPFGGDS